MLKDKVLARLLEKIQHFKRLAPVEDLTLVLAGTGPNCGSHISSINSLSLEYVEKLREVHVISGSVFSLMSCLAHREGQLHRDNFLNYDRNVRNIHKASALRCIKYIVNRKRYCTLFDNQRIFDTVLMLFGESFCAKTLNEFSYPYRFHAYCSRQEKVIELSKFNYPNITLAEVAMATASVPFMHGSFNFDGMVLSDPIFSPKIRPFRKSMFSLPGYKLYLNHKREGLYESVYFIRTEERYMPEASMRFDFFLFNLGFSNRYINKLHRYLLMEVLNNGQPSRY